MISPHKNLCKLHSNALYFRSTTIATNPDCVLHLFFKDSNPSLSTTTPPDLKNPPPPPPSYQPHKHTNHEQEQTHEVPVKLPKKMKKSASAKSVFAHFVAPEEDEINVVESRQPTTVREGNARVTEAEGDGGDDKEEVDARANDFINRFRQQLKLQRPDSII